MDGNSVSLPPSRDEIERFARWILNNGIEIGWTFHRGTKAADKTRLDTRVPTELGAATGYLATKLQSANIILPGAASSLFLVDGDTPEIVENALRIGGETFEFQTGRGRTNLVYRAPEGAELHALRWKDTEERLEAVADAYLVAPLSVHPDTGELYVQSNDLPPSELSADQVAELVALAGDSSPSPSPSRSAFSTGSASPLLDRATGPDRSSRHDADYDEACRLWRLVPDTDEGFESVLRDLRAFSASHAKGSRSNAELRKDVRRARNFLRGEGSIGADIGDPGTGDSAPGSRRLSFAPLVSVEEKPVRYFVRPWLQEGSFHLLAARKGAGKGTWLSHVAATVTLGEHGSKRGVVWISSEDSNAQDLRPRLAVAGADLGRVHVVESGWLELPRDIPELAAHVRELADIGLLVIDPLGNHIGSGKDSNAESDIRSAIGPLNGLADELGVSIVGIRHVTEKGLRDGVGMLSSVLGSSAWSQVPRAVLGIVKDDEDENVRHVGILAGNRLPPGEETESFRIEGVERENHEVEIPKAVPLGASSKSLDALLRGSSVSKSALARDALLEELAARPEGMESDALDELVAARTGLRPKSVRNIRAKSDLVRSVPIRDEVGGEVTRWTVVLSELGIAALEAGKESG